MTATQTRLDALVIGAGAAGLFAAANIGQRGGRVRVIDHAKKPAEKIRISGGGRCNFTNLETDANRFISDNPHFAKSALARYTPLDFLGLMAKYGLTWNEKTQGQLFCDQKSGAVIDMLLAEVRKGGAVLSLATDVRTVEKTDMGYRVTTKAGERINSRTLVIATGGLSIPKMGATGFAYDVAKQFGLDLVTPEPALVPFTMSGPDKEVFAGLSGVACEVEAHSDRHPSTRFLDALLFTHRGLSGPAMLQVSSYWHAGDKISINLLPAENIREHLKEARASQPTKMLKSWLEDLLPKRLVGLLIEKNAVHPDTRLAGLANQTIEALSLALGAWSVKPSGTEGWRTAEVTRGGVSTQNLSSRSMEAMKVPGLYFVGECVDVTGWLGGYNFQWAWASAHAAAEDVMTAD